MKFIILGAGLSGLSCAAGLKKRGHDVWVLDKAPEVGGLARTFRKDGFAFDYGPHFLFGPKAYDLIQSEFPSMELNAVVSTKEKMFFRNRYFNFPFDPKNILLNMDRKKIPGVVCELLAKNLHGGGTEIPGNVEEWVVQAVGRRIYEYISLGGYIEKLYGLPPTDISHEWGMQKLTFLTKWRDSGLVTLTLRTFLERNNIKKRVIHYPPGGIDHIAREIKESVERAGGHLLLNTKASSIEHTETGVVVSTECAGQAGELRGDFLVSTIPITHLISMLTPPVTSDDKTRVERLRYRTLLLLYVFVNRERILNNQCIYFTEKKFLFRRITEFKHLDASMVPKGKTSLCVEITCFDDDRLLGKKEEELFGLVAGQLAEAGYVNLPDIEGYRVLRIPFAYPVYEICCHEILVRVLDRLKEYRNLITIGRQGLFFYNAMNSSILMGYELGERLGGAGESERNEVIRTTYGARLGKYGLGA